MATTTPRFSLTKPAGSEAALISVLNANMDIVDKLGAGCRVYNNADQSIANGIGFSTLLAFNSERYDTDGFHDVAVNNSRITIPAGLGGKYFIALSGTFVNNATGERSFFLVVDATDTIAMLNAPAVNGEGTARSLSTVYSLNAGQYVQAYARQDSGGALNLAFQANFSPEFMVHKIG